MPANTRWDLIHRLKL